MTTRITATELARGLGGVLGRIRNRRESFLVERYGVLVARIGPLKPEKPARLREVVEAWASIEADPELAEDLAAVGAAEEASTDQP